MDLLIILRQSSKRFLDRIPDYLPENISVGGDVFTYTKEEIERMTQEGTPWIRHVLKEVVWLYMIRNKPKLDKFYQQLIKEAVSLGIINSENILEGLEVDLRIAKTVNGLTS